MGKRINSITFSIVVVGLLVVVGCKTTKTSRTAGTASYNALKDSLNTAHINWKKYFSDTNLVALVDEGLKNNLDLLSALQRIEIARSDERLTKGKMLPTLAASGILSQRKFGLYTMDGAGNITTDITPGRIVPIHLPDYYLGFQSSWEVDVFGKLRNKKKAAIARYLATIEGTNWTITNLISEIATSYYELLALDKELEIIKETIQLQEDELAIVRVQKQTGKANELAVKQFEAQLIQSKSMELEVGQQILETESRLNFLIGRNPQKIIREKSVFAHSLPIQPQVGIPSELLKNRPDIRQAEFNLIASNADVKAAKAAFYPSLNITGSLGFQAFNTAYLFTSPESMAYGLFGNLTAPLINRSAIKAEFNTAKANQATALYQYQKSILNGYVEVYNQLANIKNLQQIYDLKKQQVKVLNQSIETSSELFKTGRASYLEILMTQRNALESKIGLVNIQKRQYNSVINLYKALGGGWR